MTPQLAARIEQSDIDYSRSRLEGMQRAPGNPLQIELQPFGAATAYLIEAWPEFWYGNKVLGLEPASVEHLEAIRDFFGRRALLFRFEVMPGKLTSRLGAALHRLGFCQMSFNAALYGPATPCDRPAHFGSVRVRDVGPAEYDLFLDVYQAGFELPPLNDDERRAARGWLEHAQAELHLCLACVGGTPAAVGVLFVKDGIGLLADAATLPEFRGRGCQQALLHHRLTRAAEVGCDLLTSFVEFGSASHRNVERVGLRVAYTKAMWWAVD